MRPLTTTSLLLLLASSAARPAPAATPAAPPPGESAGVASEAPPTATPAGIAWFDGTFQEALERAGAERRPLLVDVHAQWCAPCQALDREVFPRPALAEATRGLVAVRIDAEAGEGPELVERYHVVGYPTVLLLDPDGQEIDRIFGFFPADEFARILRDYLSGRGTLAELSGRALAHPFDIDLAAEAGFRHAVRGDAVEAKRHFARLFTVRRLLSGSPGAHVRGAADVSRLGGTSDFGPVRRMVESDMAGALEHVDALIARAYLALGKYVYLRGAKDYARAIEILDELRQRFPDSPEASEAPYQLALAHLRQGKATVARRELRRYLDGAGDDPAAANAVAWLCHREGAFQEWGREVAEAALARHPDEAGLWDTLAELRASTGDAEGALAAARKAAETAPTDPYYAGQVERFALALAEIREAAQDAETAPPGDRPPESAQGPEDAVPLGVATGLGQSAGG